MSCSLASYVFQCFGSLRSISATVVLAISVIVPYPNNSPVALFSNATRAPTVNPWSRSGYVLVFLSKTCGTTSPANPIFLSAFPPHARQYHTGMRCPYHNWRLMHQSCRLLIQWKYIFAKRSGTILICPLFTTFRISSLSVVREPFGMPLRDDFPIVNGLSTSP